MVDVVVGHQIINSIVYLDARGQPMLVPQVPDAPPVWSNLASPEVDTSTVSADGSTDTILAVGPGQDSLSVSVTVGGNTYSAVVQINISDVPQVLTSIAIQSDVQ